MNTIGIDRNLDRARIRKLLAIGLFAASAPNLADWQMITGGLLGFFGIFLEGLAFFAIYRLMADAAPRYAYLYRAGIFGYIWLAPVGCHMNLGILNLAYKCFLQADAALAEKAANLLFCGLFEPVYLLLIVLWLPMMIVQFLAFSRGLTPYPKRARWFCIPIGAIPSLVLAAIFGFGTALGSGIGTMFLSFGNAFMFGGLLATLPDAKRFEAYEKAHS